MSTAARLISGSAASWVIIAINMASQMALVPIYLSFWDAKTYGVWLAVQGIMSVLSMLDSGHQNFLAYEFLRLGVTDRVVLGKYLWSGMATGLMICTFQIVLIVVFVYTGTLGFLLGELDAADGTLLYSAGIALFFQGLSWLLFATLPGLIGRALAGFGYFPRMAWWGVVAALMNAFTPVIAVVMGADLIITALVVFIGAGVYSLPLYIDLLKILKKEKIGFVRPSFYTGFQNFTKSLPLLGKSLFENVRQQGVRLIITPMAGPVGLVAFSTMRTGANVALQGLNTIVNPLAPDLMRFLHARDQPRTESAFATIWILVIAVMAPGVVILQAFVEPLYLLWTQNKVAFDPLLFASLSMGVLVYAVVQPAMAVVIGNNLTKTQLALTGLAALVVFAVLIVSVPFVGIVGAGMALLLAEICAAFGYKFYAKKWLRENGLSWPSRSFHIAIAALVIATISLGALIMFPDFKWITLFVSMLFFLGNVIRYWKILPQVAKQSARGIIMKIPVFGPMATRILGKLNRKTV
jgi:O-antigen/teichoic acid export membrane protein